MGGGSGFLGESDGGETELAGFRQNQKASNKNFSSKTIELVNKIEDFEFITTDTDQEAILLEN